MYTYLVILAQICKERGDHKYLFSITNDYERAKDIATSEMSYDCWGTHMIIEQYEQNCCVSHEMPILREWYEFQGRPGYYWGSGEVDIVLVDPPKGYEDGGGLI